jgi:hypothetical protein
MGWRDYNENIVKYHIHIQYIDVRDSTNMITYRRVCFIGISCGMYTPLTLCRTM